MVLQVGLSFIIMMCLDFIWIGFIAKSHYLKAYGHILRLSNGNLEPIWWAALIVYACLIFGVNYYGLSYRAEPLKAITQAAIFGWVVYAVYDFTCLSLFKNWPIFITVVDCLWGGVLCAMTAGLTIYFMAKF